MFGSLRNAIEVFFRNDQSRLPTLKHLTAIVFGGLARLDMCDGLIMDTLWPQRSDAETLDFAPQDDALWFGSQDDFYVRLAQTHLWGSKTCNNLTVVFLWLQFVRNFARAFHLMGLRALNKASANIGILEVRILRPPARKAWVCEEQPDIASSALQMLGCRSLGLFLLLFTNSTGHEGIHEHGRMEFFPRGLCGV